MCVKGQDKHLVTALYYSDPLPPQNKNKQICLQGSASEKAETEGDKANESGGGGTGSEDKGGSGAAGSGGGGDGKKDKKASTPQPPNANAMRILVLAQKGDWTACESALKALERAAMDEGGPKHPLSGISDNVRLLYQYFVLNRSGFWLTRKCLGEC